MSQKKPKKLFNKLVVFVKPTWGAHPENVKIIYEHVIEPIIHYAAGIWSAALKYKHVTNKLLSLQRLFAIKIIQGFRTISTATSISLAQLTPLPAKILAVADIELSKLRGFSRFLPSDTPLERPSPPSNLLHPALRTGVRFSEVTDLTELDATSRSDTTEIYTDGSKHDGRVGAAFIVLQPHGSPIIKRFRLHDCCSVFQAEMLAIDGACAWAIQNKIPQTRILSDSLSGLTELTNPNSCNHFAVSIFRSVHAAWEMGLVIQFAWVKAHVGIPGNEIADSAAKTAALLHRRPDYLHTPISYIKHENSLLTKQAARELYGRCTHILGLFPDLQNLTDYLKTIKPYFAITQSLTNHGYHKSYLFRFKITENDLCPCDNQSSQTLEHLIVKCPRFASTRLSHSIAAGNLPELFEIPFIMSRPETIKTYHRHISYIIKQLKSFNSLIP
ncbi:uncharacterized protein LOC120637022 [Pararge aegeria]|uniref:uncharacterized protein LOC120637022 n=1 Tax=Pararge aegeria TaxID=116150 RepID=UPI0019D16DF8|nr:uncharacterized protein LOC120637022 [Pararge aegeria]